MVEFTDEPGGQHRAGLFAMVLGHTRYLWGQYVLHQNLGTVLRCHMQVFEHFGGTPQEILYDRMKTAVLGEAADDTGIVYNAKLIGLGVHYVADGAAVLRGFATPVAEDLWHRRRARGRAAALPDDAGRLAESVAMSNCGALGWGAATGPT